MKTEHTGNKYHRTIHPLPNRDEEPITVDVYSVIAAFGITCPGRQHAIKKLLCAGLRGKNDQRQDLVESIDAIKRSIEIFDQSRERSDDN